MDLQIQQEECKGWTVFRVIGEVEAETVPKLRHELYELVAAGVNRLIVDLTEVSFLDSTGLGVLVGVLKRVRGTDGDILIAVSVASNPRVRNVFEVTGLTRVFSIFDTAAAALAHQGASAE